MSERRALEFNYVLKLKAKMVGSQYEIVESNTYEERKIPCIVVVAGDSKPMIDHPDAQDNFESDLDIIVMSSYDQPSPNEHMNVCDGVRELLIDKATRTTSDIKSLHIYNIAYQGVTDMREERRLATQIKYQVHYYYQT